MDVATHCLNLSGNNINLSSLLDQKKFRIYGSKTGAVKGFKYLENYSMGNFEVCGGRGFNKVRNYRFGCSNATITVSIVISLQEETTAS